MGMLVRGAGETFNLIVPVRRMRDYAKKQGVLWAIDTDVKVPTLEEITSLLAEGSGSSNGKGIKITKDSFQFPKLPLKKEDN
jgi:hypothetical protein